MGTFVRDAITHSSSRRNSLRGKNTLATIWRNTIPLCDFTSVLFSVWKTIPSEFSFAKQLLGSDHFKALWRLGISEETWTAFSQVRLFYLLRRRDQQAPLCPDQITVASCSKRGPQARPAFPQGLSGFREAPHGFPRLFEAPCPACCLICILCCWWRRAEFTFMGRVRQ